VILEQIVRIYYFIRLGRPLFLAGGFIFHGLGVAMALYSGADLNLPVMLWGQLVITAVQLMTHYSNDYFDLPADLANQTPTRWSGGSRILTGGHLPPSVALVAAQLLALAAIIGTLVLGVIRQTGPLTMPLLLLALLLAWTYSAPPLQLHSRGVGEITTSLLVPGLTPFIGFYLQTGQLAWWPLMGLFPLCCFQFCMLLSINFPDAAGDAAVGKKSLVVRFGGENAARLYVTVILLAYLLLPLFVWSGLPLLVALVLTLGSPLAVWQMWRFHRGAWAIPGNWNSLASWSVALLIGSAIAETAAFLLLVFYQT